MTISQEDALTLLDTVIDKAKKAGADQADALIAHSISIAHAQRLGAVETLERSEGQDLGLRILVGKRQACVSSSDFKSDAIEETIARALAMAKAVPEDPYCGLAEAGQLVQDSAFRSPQAKSAWVSATEVRSSL